MPRAASVVFDHLVNADPPAHPRIRFDTGCVLGGSVAGLLAARVLADFCRHVVIVERDELIDQASRPGVPQGRQLHVLLAAGRQWLDRWLPGFTEQAVAAGANRITSEVKAFDGYAMAPPHRQYAMLSATRPLLESVVRTHVLARANISVKRAQATGLRYRDGAVTAVEFVDRGGVDVLPADFVVDATGRSSRIARWVEDAGFDRPRLERLALPIHYATAIFGATEEAAALQADGWLSIFSPGNEVDGVCIAAAAKVAADFDRAAQAFFRLQQVVVDAAWQSSAGGDHARLDFLTGAKIAEATRLQRWTLDQIARAALTDRNLAELCTDVQYLLRHPSALAHPAVLERAVVVNLTAS
ncbi:NAD(P)/FAD-dependent oxidoreductase [Mycobacterium sherrisii]|uniref:FAD-binding domain-containing protein n=1 Tax=Mycobacterium sherrisii TaxID=243061 RepID=A0A1E3T033_9MYCO|nr:FAD-dependent monooxygenase [Mycobacterium sherrisii]MCV7032194.1 hypothetical protein [Mycobacterium sherrisii]ODR07694.1 hypothetical protein BHQ21_08165 [Mycobacterium sherrisii]ORW72486.1 hypothetical protein AWC25_19165 [Mycobacterium sherrisii]